MFDKNKIEELKKLTKVNNKIIFSYFEDEIMDFVEKKIPLSLIYKGLIEEIPNYQQSERSFTKYFNENYKTSDKKIKQQKVIAVVNFKGGVGKSTIANLLNLENKIIINLDEAQNAEELNLKESTVNFYQLKDEYGIENLYEAIEGAFEGGKDNVVLDTPGDITEFVKELALVDYFIVPFNVGDRSEKTTLNTIEVIHSLLNEFVSDRKDKWGIVLNKYMTPGQFKELDEMYEKAKAILGNRLICKTHLKYSGVVPTMEEKRISVEELSTTSAIAYGTFLKRSKDFNKDIEEMLSK